MVSRMGRELSVRINATCDERETLRRIRLYDRRRYPGPFVIVEHSNGARTTEYGLPSVAEELAFHERIAVCPL